MINPKALYEVKLILDYLPKDEYELIPKEMIEYIENNMEYDENISINPNVDLDKQNLRDDTYTFLEKIIKNVDMKKVKENQYNQEVKQYVSQVKKQNEEFDLKLENIRLNKIIESLENENKKIYKAKELLEEYNNNMKKYKEEIEKTKKKYSLLEECFSKIPNFIKNLFIRKEKLLLLNSGK